MPNLGQRGFIHILGILILLAGIIGGLYLVQHPTIFKPKATVSGTRIEIVDSSGNPITTTSSLFVKVKLTYVIPTPVIPTPVPSPSPTTPTEARVFITKTKYYGDLGGLAGADSKCQASADVARLGGTWKAWLTDDTGGVWGRFKFPNVYKLLDGTIVSSHSGDIKYFSMPDVLGVNILLTESRDTYDSRYNTEVWSNTNYKALRVSDSSCKNWTSKSSLDFGRVGIAANRGSGQWADQGTQSCIGLARLYCFEQIGSSIPTLTPSTFPTDVRISNLQDNPSAFTDYTFDMNGKIIDWNLANFVNSTEPGQKTIYAQFKVDGVWGPVLSTTVTYNAPIASSTPAGRPQAVTGPTAVCLSDNKSAKLSWNKSEGATIYQLRVDDISNTWLDSCTNLNSGDSCANVYTESHTVSTEPGHTYKWWLTAGNTAGDSSSTYGTNFICPNIAPQAATNLTATCANGSAKLNWDSVVGASIYKLRVDSKANSWLDSCTNFNSGDSCANLYTNSHTFQGTQGASYTWWLTACNTVGCSPNAYGSVTCTAP